MKEREFNWDIFFTFLRENLIVPVIGSDLILIKYEGKTISLYEYLTIRLGQRLKVDNSNLSFMSFMLRYQDNTLVNSIIKPIYNEIRWEDIETEPLIKLSRITDFKFFLSTTFDHFFEEALNRARCQQNEEVETINYSLSFSAERERESNKEKVATVFKLLGGIKARSYARTEEEALEYFYSLTRENPLTLRLSEEVDGKSLLFIGNTLPEWLNRFFIRVISNEAFSKSEHVKFFADNRIPYNPDLYTFLHHFKAEIFRMPESDFSNTVDFVNQLYDKWLENNRGKVKRKYDGTVFLSFSSRDRAIISEIKDRLKENGVEVWYDEHQLEAGSVYDKQIEKQIKSCRLFVPFISENSICDPEKYVYKKEWRLAESRRLFFEAETEESFITPFIIDNSVVYDERIPEVFRKLTMEYSKNTDIVERIIKNLSALENKV